MKKNKVTPPYKLIFFGFLMGCAELVPGVSGSAIALMGGIYEGIVETLYRITQISKEVLKFIARKSSFSDVKEEILKTDFKFVIPLGIGVVVSFLTMTSVVLWMLENYPHYLFTVLLALLLSAVFVPYLEMEQRGWKEFFIAFGAFLICSLLLLQEDGSMKTDPSLIILLLGGFLGISGMILPGVSGGVILLVMGIYYYVIDSVHSFITLDFTTEQFVGMAIFGVGAVVGFFIISITMRKLLVKNRSIFMASIIGLVLSSAPTLWPFVEITGYSDSGKPIIEQVGMGGFTDSQILTMFLLFLLVFGVTMWLNFRSYRDVKAGEMKF